MDEIVKPLDQPLEDEDPDDELHRPVQTKNDFSGAISTKERLRQSEANLNEAQRVAKVGSWFLDTQTNEVLWSKELYNMYHFDSDYPPPPYTEHSRLFTPESWQLLSAAISNTLEHNTPYELELQTVKDDGSHGWMWVRGEVVLDATGNVSGIQGIAQDITERKLSELDLLASKQRLDEIIWGTNAGTWEWNVQTGETIFSDRWADIAGYTLEALSPVSIDTWLTLAHPDDLKQSAALLEKHFAHEIDHYEFESRMRHNNGDWVWVLDRGKVIEWTTEGKPLRMSGTHLDITEKKRVEEALQQSHALYLQAQAMANMGHWSWDLKQDKLITCSVQFAQIFGMTVPEALDYFISTDSEINLVHPDDKERFTQAHFDPDRRHAIIDLEYRIIIASGDTRHLYARSELVLDDDGTPAQSFGTIQDVTTEKEKEFALIQATKTAQAVNRALVFQKHAMDEHAIVSVADVTGSIIYANDKFCAISGYERKALLDNNHRIVKSDEHSKAFFKDMWQTISSGNTWHGDIKNISRTGEDYWVKTTIVPTLDDKGTPFQYVGIRTDITERKQAEEQLKLVAHYDLLTHLPNRALVTDRLSLAMLQCQRHQQSLAVAYLDLDGFKDINDIYGHQIGDDLLIALSTRMKQALREGDTLSRIGGDEFIAIMVDLDKTEDSKPVLERLLKAVADPILVGDAMMQVSASIGVTLYPQDDADADQLMRHADQAMYIAKQAGKNCYHLFDTAENNEINIKREVIGDVGLALARDEFVLHYQPQVNMHTGEVIGVEALLRWQHSIRGLVPPLDFLPSIEGHTISLELGEWVINTALSQISQWQGSGVNLPISVNISAYQLQQHNFANRLAAILATHPDINASCLELEILETSALNDISRVTAAMNACHDLGVRFALDDFGTGYSSLTYLRRLPAQLIKIDQSFVRDMLEDSDDLAIVEGVVGLAKAFHRDVIAEGVETIAHGTALLQLGCELAQGYGIARPMPADDIPDWVSNWKADDCWLA